MFGPMHYGDLERQALERQDTLLREARQWRLIRLAPARARAKGRRPDDPWRLMRQSLAGARWGLTRPGAGRPSAA
jgi:hypothetical protein